MTTEPLFQDPRELKDPLVLTPGEQKQYEELKKADLSTAAKVSMVIGGAAV